jgi:hypothetical protein
VHKYTVNIPFAASTLSENPHPATRVMHRHSMGRFNDQQTFSLPSFYSSGINCRPVCPVTYDIHDEPSHCSNRFVFSSRENTSESLIDRGDAGNSLSRGWHLYDHRMETHYRGEDTGLDDP